MSLSCIICPSLSHYCFVYFPKSSDTNKHFRFHWDEAGEWASEFSLVLDVLFLSFSQSLARTSEFWFTLIKRGSFWYSNQIFWWMLQDPWVDGNTNFSRSQGGFMWQCKLTTPARYLVDLWEKCNSQLENSLELSANSAYQLISESPSFSYWFLFPLFFVFNFDP